MFFFLILDPGKISSAAGETGQDQQKLAGQDGPFTNWFVCLKIPVTERVTYLFTLKGEF